MNKFRLYPILFLFAITACVPQADTPSAALTLTPGPTETTQPTSSPTPDIPATQDAEQLKLTVQAYQTETAAVKATERAESTSPMPGMLPIDRTNAGQLTLMNQLDLGPIFGAKISPDGHFAVILTDAKTHIVDLDASTITAEINEDVFSNTVFSPTETGFAAVSRSGTLYLKPGPDAPLISLQVHQDDVLNLVFSPGSNQIITSSLDGTIQIRDFQTGELVHTIDADSAFGSGMLPDRISFSADGEKAGVYFTYDSTLWIGDASSLFAGTPSGQLIPWLDHAGPVADALISPDWQHIAWISRGTLQLMTIEGEKIGDPIGHQDWIMQTAFTTSLNSFLVVTVNFDAEQEMGVVKAYDLTTGESNFERSAPGMIVELALLDEEDRLVTGHIDGTIRIWDLTIIDQSLNMKPHTGMIQAITFTPNDDIGASIDENGSIQLWSVADGSSLGKIDMANSGYFVMEFNAEGTQLTIISEEGLVQSYGVQP